MAQTVEKLPISGSGLLKVACARDKIEQPSHLPFFLVGPENPLLPVVVAALLGEPPGAYDPVCLLGRSGCGKSHLLSGVVGVWRGRYGPRSAVYLDSADLRRELTEAIEQQSTEELETRYRRVKLLAIDNLHELTGHIAEQQQLIAIVDTLLTRAHVFVALNVAGGLSGLIAPLRSRLEAGLLVPIAPPSQPTKLAAVQEFTRLFGAELTEEAAQRLARRVPASFRAIRNACAELAATAPHGKRTLDIDDIERWLAGRLTTGSLSLRKIAAATARRFSIPHSQLRSGSQRRVTVIARDVAMYLARAMTGSTLKQIGAFFSGRDHTTVAHGCARIERLLSSDPALRAIVDQLCDELQAETTQ